MPTNTLLRPDLILEETLGFVSRSLATEFQFASNEVFLEIEDFAEPRPDIMSITREVAKDGD